MTAPTHAPDRAPARRARSARRWLVSAAGMPRVRRFAAGATAAAIPAACDRGPGPPSAADQALAARATGVWDAELRLDTAPRGAQTDAPPGVPVRVSGALTLLARARGERAVNERAAERWLRRPVTLTGVYDVAIARFGFSLPHRGDVAGLVAATAAPDSLVVVLPAGAPDRVLILRGMVAGDAVRGTWRYAGYAVPAWRGTFQLRRRPAAASTTGQPPAEPPADAAAGM